MISVCIPVLNNADKISRCLEAVLNQSLKPYEVIVVDGHSTDGTVDIAKRYPVKVLYENYHTRAGALQVGVNNAHGDLIAFTDADCIPDRDWLFNLYTGFNNGVAGVGGRFEDIGASLWVSSINSTFQTPLSGARSRWDEKKTMKVLSVCGANGMVRRRDIYAVGGFNVRLKGAEDLEFATRLGKLGPFIYTPDAVIYHDHDRGLWSFIKRAFNYGRHRRQAELLDAQVAVAILAPVLFLFSGIYMLLALTIGILTAWQHRRWIFALTVPVAFVAQHTAFIAGYWVQLLTRGNR